MKKWIIYLLLVAGCVAAVAKPSVDGTFKARPARTSPNVLLIISDDQGYGDFGFIRRKDPLEMNNGRMLDVMTR